MIFSQDSLVTMNYTIDMRLHANACMLFYGLVKLMADKANCLSTVATKMCRPILRIY
jgi:hypothetical protein